jgi:hypothetical protein
MFVQLLDSRTGELLREHLGQKRGGHRILDRDLPLDEQAPLTLHGSTARRRSTRTLQRLTFCRQEVLEAPRSQLSTLPSCYDDPVDLIIEGTTLVSPFRSPGSKHGVDLSLGTRCE